MKKLLAFGLVLALILGMSSFSLAEGDVAWDTDTKAQVVISTINNYYTAGLEKLCEEYNALHPETEVVLEIISDNDTYKTNFITKVSTDKNLAPDIYHFNVAGLSAAEGIGQGWVLDLNESWLDEPNPYADGKTTRELISSYWMNRAISEQSGYATYVPFDNVSVCVYYNIDVFDSLNLAVPTTYEEWLDVCEKLVEAGYERPIGASSVAGWYMSALSDSAYRSRIDEFKIVEGDALWDETLYQANLTVEYAYDDLTFDDGVVFNAERTNTYILENGYINDTNKDIWSKFFGLAKYFQSNWATPDENSINSNFITQQCPMLINGTWVIGDFVSQVAKLPENMQFNWGTFMFPGPAECGTEETETYEGVWRNFMTMGHLMSIMPKGDDQTARAKDVLMYWYSPQGAQMIYNETLANGNFVQGPPLIDGVELSDEILGYLGNLTGIEGTFSSQWINLNSNQGNAVSADIPLLNDLLNEASEGNITIDEFFEQANAIWLRNMEDSKARNGYDGDPTTLDTPPQ